MLVVVSAKKTIVYAIDVLVRQMLHFYQKKYVADGTTIDFNKVQIVLNPSKTKGLPLKVPIKNSKGPLRGNKC